MSRSSTTIDEDPGLPPVHPGEILWEEFLVPLGVSVTDLAGALALPLSRVEEILAGHRPISGEIALRLGRHFNMSPEFWLTLQSTFELESARDTVGQQVEREVVPRVA